MSDYHLPTLFIRLFNYYFSLDRLHLDCCSGTSDLLATSSAILFICRDHVPFEFERWVNLSVCNDRPNTDQDQVFVTEPV